jgi:hypothetical protein
MIDRSADKFNENYSEWWEDFRRRSREIREPDRNAPDTSCPVWVRLLERIRDRFPRLKLPTPTDADRVAMSGDEFVELVVTLLAPRTRAVIAEAMSPTIRGIVQDELRRARA